ncbi:hypothetical protein HAX54_010240 [Datura stramonium]|uniref:C2H2-type domain-containing protein n=1 Tax=Datura stramonium TaxID=4076 RepID=A0ABS8RWN7_DATST|nr:hypothetical protein [Datura stramonium]
MHQNQNISSHAVGQRSQSSSNLRYFEEASQACTKFLPESSILCSCRKCSLQRQMSEHYRSHHHNNQVPTDQFEMNRPAVSPTSRPIQNSLYKPSYAAIGLPVDPFLRALKRNPNFSMPKVRSDERSTTNNIRTDNAPSRVPMLHQSSSHLGREVVEQEHGQSMGDYPRVIRPIPTRPYDPSCAAIGLPVDTFLRALKRNPNFSMPKVRSDERSTANNIRTGNAPSRVPALHQSSSHSGREVVKQEHGQSMGDYPRVISPIPTRPYDPSSAAIGLPVDPFLHIFKRNPNFPMPKVRSDERSTTNNIRTDNAPSRVPTLHQSSSHSGREVVGQEHGQGMGDYPRVIRPIPTRPYDPSYAAIGPPVNPLLRAFKQNPNNGLPKGDE